MDNLVMCFIIVCICVDQGDGHWKENDREHLRHDIELYKHMAEKIEREIESFYVNYPDETFQEKDFDRTHFSLRIAENRQKELVNYQTKDTRNSKALNNNFKNITGFLPKNDVKKHNVFKVRFKTQEAKKINVFKAPWPKFEDILLAMGKKYDWKNDIWIKVRRKKSGVNKHTNAHDDNSVGFHEKHKFSYRMIKLNRSKSRRNVVVAVTAVR